jgi:electron-transferring-flavoprotein dehydrogenase
MTQEALYGDVVIVGAGPAGLSAAIRLKRLNSNLQVCVLEKASEVGAHILSGAVLEPRALKELLPQQDLSALSGTEVTCDAFYYLTEKKSFALPVPPLMQNEGNLIISLSVLCRILAKEAENLGVEIYTGFSAVEAVFDEKGEVCGVKTDDKGLDKKGEKTSRYTPGVMLKAKTLLLAEGARGSLSKQLIKHFSLDKSSDPQTYGLGVKEIWEIDPTNHEVGKVVHTIGWPLDNATYGGSFIYHQKNHRLSIGFVVGLDFKNPSLDPFQELQQLKLHPTICPLFQKAKRIAYGARVLSEGGVQSLPVLNFPGGLIMGDAAGFLNVPKMKGIHLAMKSGMVAAETCVAGDLTRYQENLKRSWLWEECYRARNIRPGFQYGLWKGMLLAGMDAYLFRGKAPWTLHHKKPDYASLDRSLPAKMYPKPDNKITFDKITSLYLSNIHHEEMQPCHLKVTGEVDVVNYCPAQVYEIVEGKLQIQPQNCLHCKACDVKDPNQHITWVPPEGGSGPHYSEM